MDWELDLRAGFRVRKDGWEFNTPFPTVTTAVLLLLLIEAKNGWIDRKSIAAALYPYRAPETSANAVRQTIHRLRGWLGFDILESEKNRLRLHHPWKLVTAPSGDPGTLAFGVEHPYIDKLRLRFAPLLESPAALPETSIHSLLTSVSAVDQEIARELLIASQPLLESCSQRQVSQILADARPRRSGDHLAAEYLLVACLQSVRFANLKKSIQEAERAFRIARHRNNRTLQAEAAAYSMFFNLESGNLDQANAWLGILQSSERILSTRLLVHNAEIAYFWNMGEPEKALPLVAAGQVEIRGASRRTRLHFCANTALFLAESRLIDEALEMVDEAEKLLIPRIDRWHCQIIEIAKAEVKIQLGLFEEASAILSNVSSLTESEDYPANRLYCLSQEARIHAGMKRPEKAASTWQNLESSRKTAEGNLNPRLLKQKAEVFGTPA